MGRFGLGFEMTVNKLGAFMDQLDPLCERLTWYKHLHGQSRAYFQSRLLAMQSTIAQVLEDDLGNLIPILLVCEADITSVRNRVGRATWRRIHHASEHTNFLRSLIRLRFGDDADWAAIVALPDHHLRSCRNAVDWPTARVAARLAEPGRFAQAAMLYRDVVKMGGSADHNWTLAQLKRAHARLSAKTVIAAADPTAWCAAFEFEHDTYRFTRLVSDRDFVTEGKALRHCVASFRAAARAGTTIVLRCMGPDRATVRFTVCGEMEIGGFANTAVSDRCVSAAQAAIEAFKHSCGPDGSIGPRG